MRRRSWIHTIMVLGALGSIAPVAAAQDDEAPPTGLRVREVQIGTSLERGLVTDPQTSIARDAGRIFAVIRLDNPSREETTIRVAIERVDGPRRGGFSLDVPPRRRYRTVARFGSSHPPGRYRIVIRTAEGVELESVELTITG